MSDLFGNGVKLTENVLDNLWQRQQITANNIANVDTPDYKYKYLTFEDELANKIKSESYGSNQKKKIASAIDATKAKVHTVNNESSRLDGNNVDMDMEQVDLAKTTLEYQYMVNSVSNELKRLGSAAKSF